MCHSDLLKFRGRPDAVLYTLQYGNVGVARLKTKHSTKALYKSADRTVQTDAEEMAAQPVNVLITGANRGLGLELVKQMVETYRPVRNLFASCRDPEGPRAEVRVFTPSVPH